MKITNKLITAVLAGSLVVSTGCQKFSDFEDTNLNPAATTSPITSALLTNVLSQLGGDNVTAGFASNDKAGIFAQYFAESSYPSISHYALPIVEFDGTYSGPLYDLQNILNVSTSNTEKAVARIVKAYLFSRLTDRFGDIPYFNALKGVTPGYDRQELIYKDLLKELTEANLQLDQGGPLKGDIMYGNNPAQWKKLANSLRMIMAMRLSERFPAAGGYAATEFNAALTAPGGSIDNNADNWKVQFTGATAAFSNPFYNNNQNNRDYGVSAPFATLLSQRNDTRISALASSTSLSDAVPYGLTETNINAWRNAHPNWMRTMSPANRLITSPVYLVSAAQVLLARAEAAERGWTSENAVSLYEQGIDASFAQWNLTTPASYKTQASIALNNDPALPNLAKIAIQEYIASFPDGTEGWNIWRRTGYPVLTPSPSPVSPDHATIPRRYVYGGRQSSLNPSGYATAIANQGPDVQETKVWWDL